MTAIRQITEKNKYYHGLITSMSHLKTIGTSFFNSHKSETDHFSSAFIEKRPRFAPYLLKQLDFQKAFV